MPIYQTFRLSATPPREVKAWSTLRFERLRVGLVLATEQVRRRPVLEGLRFLGDEDREAADPENRSALPRFMALSISGARGAGGTGGAPAVAERARLHGKAERRGERASYPPH
jgi:hypothetical protein